MINIPLSETWTATDDCGNTTSCLQTIDVQDTTDPTWDQGMPADATVECDNVPSVPGGLTFSDNCGASGQTPAFVQTSTQGSDQSQCDYYNYTITRTWTATDECGNTTVHTQTITVEDTTAPTYTAPANVNADVGLQCGDENDVNNSGFPTGITDNCANPTDATDGYTVGATSWMTTEGYTISFTDNVVDPHPAGECTLSGNGLHKRKYRVERTWTVTDPCGNGTAAGVQNININDDTPPVITCPADVTIECDESQDPTMNANLGEATATDNCDLDNEITITYGDVSVAGSCTGEEDHYPDLDRRGCLWKYAATCVQTIEVEDTTPPDWDPEPMDVTVECGPMNGTDFSDWLVNHANAGADDACSNATVSSSGLTSTDGCGNTVVYQITVTAEDECGNSVSQAATFTIVDTTKTKQPPDLTSARLISSWNVVIPPIRPTPVFRPLLITVAMLRFPSVT